MSNCDSYLSFRLQKFQDDVQMLGAKIKHYESGIKFLKGETNRLDDLILDMQGTNLSGFLQRSFLFCADPGLLL